MEDHVLPQSYLAKLPLLLRSIFLQMFCIVFPYDFSIQTSTRLLYHYQCKPKGTQTDVCEIFFWVVNKTKLEDWGVKSSNLLLKPSRCCDVFYYLRASKPLSVVNLAILMSSLPAECTAWESADGKRKCWWQRKEWVTRQNEWLLLAEH